MRRCEEKRGEMKTTPDNEEAGPSGDRAERQAGARSGVGQSGAAGGQNTDLTTAGANALSCSEQTVPPVEKLKIGSLNINGGRDRNKRAVVKELTVIRPEGGQGLIDLSCRVRTFRLQAAQRLLYGEEIAWADTAYALLCRVEDLNYDKHLFVLSLRKMDLSATTLFYQSVLRAWSSVLRISRINAQPFPCTEEYLYPTAFPESRNHQSQRSEDAASLPPAEDGPNQTFIFIFAGTRSASLLIGGGDCRPHLPPSLWGSSAQPG
ncbi:hypothetical protein QTP86_008430 [Hemibagrus guttatus]|nr:hypothetical protein QTP86_008430 [Hemibagrus guttatus]